jgi:phospholipase C
MRKYLQATWRPLGFGAALLSTMMNLVAPPIAAAQQPTTTPIQHVIVIIGENRSFDHVFGTYQPPQGQTIANLLSKGIVNADGTPGPNFSLAAQYKASDTTVYQLSPSKTLFHQLPPPSTGSTPAVASDTNPAPFATKAAAEADEPGLLPSTYKYLTTGASGLPNYQVDTRIANAFNLPNGPFQLTHGLKYDDYAASPVHRFYQMWQQADCSIANATSSNPSGCVEDFFPYVEISVGAGSNGAAKPSPFTPLTTGEGSSSMGFYNVSQGDMPYFTSLVRQYALADNYHQPVMGGTGANSFALGSGDAIWYSDGNGSPATPASNEIENPDPQPGTNNWYTQDGYSGGTYSNCADSSQPGVPAILNYLASLPYNPKPNCDAGHYYLLNNYSPGYFGDGSVNTGTFVIPPSTVPTIADDLIAHNISWKYYGEDWDAYVQDPTYSNTQRYCDICNPFQYETSIMTNSTIRQNNLKDVTDLYNDIQTGTLPAVSFVKPDGYLDGHPASSKFDLFEAFTQKIIKLVQSKPEIWKSTAIFITVDEGGGYYDSGYIQPLDFFGDGTRIPLIVVSPYATGGRVVHDYYDHVSILKFIEKNWGLPPISGRSRDNLPNPTVNSSNPYVPTNSPAIGDLTGMFNFNQ